MAEDAQQVSTCQDSMEDTRELVDPINEFPTANKPILTTTLKDILVSLSSSLQADMMQCMSNIKAEVGELGGRIDHIEQKMGAFASSYNTLVDAHNDQSDDITWLKAKVATSGSGTICNGHERRWLQQGQLIRTATDHQALLPVPTLPPACLRNTPDGAVLNLRRPGSRTRR